MRKILSSAKLPLAAFALFAFLVAGANQAFAGATIQIVNLDGPNEGFNDPTPAAPVGGNPGMTLGAQRLFAFTHAANIWGSKLDSNQVIRIQAAFNPLAPNVLGSAGATFVFSDFGGVGLYPGSLFPSTWYSSALADKRAGAELNPGFADINAQFSSNFNFYLGVDNNHGAQNDLVAVLLHEFAHGLGFQNFVTETTGANLAGQTDVYSQYTLDITNGMHWSDMDNAQRAASAVRFGKVVWDGPAVTAAVPSVLAFGSPELRVINPPSIAGTFQFGTASFGPPVGSPNVLNTAVVAVQDPDEDGASAAFTATDGCTAFSNAAAVAGKIALVERGGCGFAVKARNASAANAAAVIIYNQAANAAAAPPGMAGDGINDPFVTIPSVSVTRNDGLALLGAPGATASLLVDLTVRAGADPAGHARLYAPFPVALGSSISHYDTVSRPNQLMEPAINGDLTHSLTTPQDMTLPLMRDIGWFPDADLDGLAADIDCDDTTDFSPTIVIDGCDTGVPNPFYADGCSLSDKIHALAEGATNHGQWVSAVAHYTNALRKAGAITNEQKSAIQSCAAGASLP